MNKKLFTILLIIFTGIISPAYGFEISNELKAGAVYLVKISIGVVISSIVIGIGLWIYSRIKNNKLKKSPNSRAKDFKCDIDDTNSIDEAISTFLKINNN